MPKSSSRPAADPGAVLADHFPRDLTDAALTHSDASLVLDITCHGRWTVAVDDGTAEVTTKVAAEGVRAGVPHPGPYPDPIKTQVEASHKLIPQLRVTAFVQT